MHLAVEVGKGEVGGDSGKKIVVPPGNRFAEEPDGMCVVVSRGLSEQAREHGKVDGILAPKKFALAAGRNRHTDVVATESLGFNFPSGDSEKVSDGEPQIIALGRCRSDVRVFVAVYDCGCHGWSEATVVNVAGDRKIRFSVTKVANFNLWQGRTGARGGEIAGADGSVGRIGKKMGGGLDKRAHDSILRIILILVWIGAARIACAAEQNRTGC